MMLGTIIAIADDNIPISVYYENEVGDSYRYNFISDAWDTTPLTADKIVTVGTFKQLPIFKNIKKYKLITLAYQPTRNVSTLTKSEKKEVPNVLTVSVSKPKNSKYKKNRWS